MPSISRADTAPLRNADLYDPWIYVLLLFPSYLTRRSPCSALLRCPCHYTLTDVHTYLRENANVNGRYHISNLHIFQSRLPSNYLIPLLQHSKPAYTTFGPILPPNFNVRLVPGQLVCLVQFSRCSPSLIHPFGTTTFAMT
jgi:hypothetical protein